MNLNKLKNKKLMILLFIVLLIALPFIIEFIAFKRILLNKSMIIRISVIYLFYLAILTYKIINKYFDHKIEKLIKLIVKYRYYIALAIFIVMVLFKINFSSLDIWIQHLNEDESLKSTLIGSPKAIRTDEWVVYTPLMLAQAQNNEWYAQYNSNVEQGNYNMMINNLPVFNITIISHPLQWGFLLFGMEYGYSWYWSMKIILLFLVSIEIMLIITKKDEILSLAGGILLALAPCMMWWLSTSVVDAYIYGIAIIVLFYYYMDNIEKYNTKNKLLIALGMIIAIPGFAMTLYPAYQIPLAYMIACFIIIKFIDNFKKIKKYDYFIMICTLVISLIIVGYFILVSWNDIQIEMNTVYPGARFETGGNFTISNFVQYFTNIYLPWNQAVADTNACEVSTYIYPFAGTIILLIYTFIKQKNNLKDNKLLIGLSLIFVLLLIWCFIGFPKILAKISLLYNSQAERTGLVMGLIGTIICFLLLAKYKENEVFSKLKSFLISLIIMIIAFIILKNSEYYDYFSMIKLEIALVIFFVMTYALLSTNKKIFSVVVIFVAIISGALVNPITKDIKIFTKTNIYKEIKRIDHENSDALWIGSTGSNAQYLIASGVNTLNGVNPYPNFKWLNEIDPDRVYENVYNRYAHISIDLGDKTEFVLIYGDNYKAILTHDDIKKLGISYMFCTEEMEEEKMIKFDMENIYSDQNKNQYIYKFK